MRDNVWKQWQRDWRRMEKTARKRGWEVTLLAIAPPATESAVKALESRHGINVPAPLRELLTRYSARVTFGWYIPAHLQPMDRQGMPHMSANRRAIWDIEHIDGMALPDFLGLKEGLADVDLSEAPNRPQRWEHQFPFYALINGDMLTIDTSRPEGPHPVRYFSHELAGLHGMAVAPDFLAFVTEMSKLGFAGTEWYSWGSFGTWNEADETYYLKADSVGGKAWLAWLAKDPNQAEADEPPPSIVEKTPADRALLEAAQAGDVEGVERALANGAEPNVVPSSDWMMDEQAWDDEFSTALCYAVRANNLALADRLLDAGARLDTRRLPVSDAVQYGSLETLRWLIARGARVNGWKNDRYWPIHLLVTVRTRAVAPERAELEKRLLDEWNIDGSEEMGSFRRELIAKQLACWLDRPTYLAMLDTLLKAGADPDARWDNGTTMLFWAEPDDGELLLRAGADVNARESGGSSALHHYARTPEKMRLLVAFGADVNALETPHPDDESEGCTPLQSALLLSRISGLDRVQALLELNADPHKRAAGGRSTLCYCPTIEAFQLVLRYGLDPAERLPDGGTLLHNLFRMSGVRASKSDEVAFLDFLLDLGLPINATDNQGRAALHIAAEGTETVADVALLLERGADRSLRNKNGERPFDRVRKSLKDIRQLLK